MEEECRDKIRKLEVDVAVLESEMNHVRADTAKIEKAASATEAKVDELRTTVAGWAKVIAFCAVVIPLMIEIAKMIFHK